MIRDTAVIIPVYNEASVIASVIASVKKKFEHVVCVDDGSIDTSSSEIQKAKAELIVHPINLGQGAALQTGIEYALLNKKIKYFITYDADGQHSLSDAVTMLETIRKDNTDVILGSRFLGAVENITVSKKLLLKAAVKFSNFTTGLQLSDTHNGLRVFNRRVAEKLNITMPDMAHASEIIQRIADHEFSYQELPVTISYTDYSKAKGQSAFNAVNIGFDVLLNRITKK